MGRGMGERASLLASSGVFVVLLWIGTSLARGKGFVLLLGGMVLLGFALWRFSRGHRDTLYGLYFSTLLLVAPILVAELALRSSGCLLAGRLANYVHGGYHDEPEGIYARDAHLGRALRPGVRRLMYWNGHWWWHEANADGYRGPALKRAAAVFLGDSLVYGHGVETPDTVAARFASATGRPAANLGLQGASLLQALVLLHDKGLPLRPEVVFLCVHPNDLADVAFWYEPDEVRRFLADSREAPYVPLVRYGLRTTDRTLSNWWLMHGAVPLRSARLLRGVLRQASLEPERGGPRAEVAAPGRRPWLPEDSVLREPFAAEEPGATEELRLAWAASRHAVERMKGLCDDAGARLVLFDLGYPREFSAAVEALAGALEIRYSPAGRVALERARAGDEVYLADDGHWSPLGSQVVARELAVAAGLR